MPKTHNELAWAVADYISNTAIGDNATALMCGAGVIACQAMETMFQDESKSYEEALAFMLANNECPEVYPHEHEKTDYERGASCPVCGYLPDPTASQIQQMRDEYMADMHKRD